MVLGHDWRCGRGQQRTPVTTYYPGEAYCDMVGLDNYSDNVAWHGYDQLVRLGKPFAATEYGASKHTGSRGSYDYSRLIREIKKRYPLTTYFLVWSGSISLAANRNAKGLLSDPWVVNRGEIDWK